MRETGGRGALLEHPELSVSTGMVSPLVPGKVGFMCFHVLSLEISFRTEILGVSPFTLLTSSEVSREENSEILVIGGWGEPTSPNSIGVNGIPLPLPDLFSFLENKLCTF